MGILKFKQNISIKEDVKKYSPPLEKKQVYLTGT